MDIHCSGSGHRCFRAVSNQCPKQKRSRQAAHLAVSSDPKSFSQLDKKKEVMGRQLLKASFCPLGDEEHHSLKKSHFVYFVWHRLLLLGNLALAS